MAIERSAFGPDAWSRAAFRRLQASAGRPRMARHRLWVATRSGQVVGYAGLEVSTLGDEADLVTLAVDPAHRRRGVGRRLVQHALSEARRRGLGLMWLRLRASGRAARHLYARQGFRVVGRLDDYYEAPREPAILMARRP